MATIIINERSAGAKKMIEFLKTQRYVTFVEEKKPTSALLKAMDEAKKGKTTEYKSTEDLFATLRKKSDV
jgi:hypothetical protein